MFFFDALIFLVEYYMINATRRVSDMGNLKMANTGVTYEFSELNKLKAR